MSLFRLDHKFRIQAEHLNSAVSNPAAQSENYHCRSEGELSNQAKRRRQKLMNPAHEERRRQKLMNPAHEERRRQKLMNPAQEKGRRADTV